MRFAEFLVDMVAAYALAGAIFAGVFVTRGIQRMDPVAQHAPWGFRLIVTPGVAALWPFLLIRWYRAASRAVRP